MPLFPIQKPRVLFTGLAFLFVGCSDASHTQQADYQLPDSEVRVSLSIQTHTGDPQQHERKITVSDNGKELFSTKLDTAGKPKAKLYQQKNQTYVLVDNNGDRYMLNFRDKQFEKSDAKGTKTAGNYVGKFDYDKNQAWLFVPGKPRSENNGQQRSTASTDTNGTSRRSFGPPSKHF